MKNTPHLKKKFSNAMRLFDSGELGQAEALLLEVQEAIPEDESVLVELVRLYINSKQSRKALVYLERLTVCDPENVEYYLHVAQLSQRLGLSEKSIEAYRQLLKRKPDLPNSQYNLARLLKRSGLYFEAIAAYEQALKYKISDAEEVFTNIGVIYAELNRSQDAVFWIEKALLAKPDYIPALFNRAALYEELGHRPESQEIYEKILEIDGSYYPALCRIAYMQDAESCENPIIGKLQSALDDEGIRMLEKEEVCFALGKVLDDCGDFDRAFANYCNANELGRNRFSPYSKSVQEDVVDRIIKVFNAPWFSQHAGISKFSPVFICGMYRSGSTLVESILSRHPKVKHGGELSFFPDLIRELGRGYPEEVVRFGREYFDGIAGEYQEYLRSRSVDAPVVTDKRPDNYLHVGFIKSVFPEARIIWTKRELLDNCLSIYFQQLGGNLNYSVDLDFIGHYFRQHVKLMIYWRSLFPGSIFEMDYEKLVDNPSKEVGSLLSFLGLEWDEACLDFSSGSESVKTASIWQVRKGVYGRSSGRHVNYRDHLSVLQEYLIDTQC